MTPHGTGLVRWLKGRLSLREYLAYQAGGSMLVNAAINGGFAWSQRAHRVIPLDGSPSVAADTYLTAALLAGLTVLVGSLFVRLDMHLGRVEPFSAPVGRPWVHQLARSTFFRALLFAAGACALIAPPVLTGLRLAGVEAMPFWTFFGFKIAFAVVLGLLVTPINAACALIARADRRAVAPPPGTGRLAPTPEDHS